MELYLQACITVLSLINPAVCGMIFEGGESARSPAQRLADASKAAIAILVILELAAECWCGWGSPCCAGAPPVPPPATSLR